MKKRLFVPLACAGLFVVVSAAPGTTLTEDFSTDPLQRGWQVFGDTNQFTWDATNHNLAVTWDSSHPNSYFYYPLGVSLTRYDDFSLEFDLHLNDIASNVEPGKTGPMELGFGFLNLAEATSTNFMRGGWGDAPDVAEFDYYAYGYYYYNGANHPSPASAVPSFIPGTDSYDYAPMFVGPFVTEVPTNQTVHVRMSYSGANQSATVAISVGGVPLSDLPPLVLTDPDNSEFSSTDNFHVDTFSISSYSSAGDDYDSILAHGTVDNLAFTVLRQPITRFTGGPAIDGSWQVQFFGHSNWLYTLERSDDLKSWAPVSDTTPGTEDLMTLQDTDPPTARGFYHVRAQQP